MPLPEQDVVRQQGRHHRRRGQDELLVRQEALLGEAGVAEEAVGPRDDALDEGRRRESLEEVLADGDHMRDGVLAGGGRGRIAPAHGGGGVVGCLALGRHGMDAFPNKK